MKTLKNMRAQRPYESPKAEVIEIGTQTVLCASGVSKGNSTENVSISGFDWI